MQKRKVLTAAQIADLKNQPIKSFVRHHGRLTAGQQQALEDFWQDFGIDYQDNILDLKSFGQFEKVVLEIGFGNGESFIKMAESAPDTLFIGAEVHKPGVGRALMLANQRGVSNIRVVEHDAVAFIDKMLPARCLDRVQVFFPDPWHKKRHFKRRLIQAAFCQKLARVMKVGAILHVVTDWTPYAEHCLEVINDLDFFTNTAENGDYIDKPDYRPTTKFEQRGVKLGHSVKEMAFRLCN